MTMHDIKNVSPCRPSALIELVVRGCSYFATNDRSNLDRLWAERETERPRRRRICTKTLHNLLNINRRWVREDLRSNRGQCFQNSL